MKKLYFTFTIILFISFLCSCDGAKNYEEIQKSSIECVEKVLQQISSNGDIDILFKETKLIMLNAPTYDESVIQWTGSYIQEKLNGYDYDDFTISQSVDTVMDGSKLLYSIVNVQLPDSKSFEFHIEFDGHGVTGTEGKAHIIDTRGLINKTSSKSVDGIQYQINYSHQSDLADYIEEKVASFEDTKIIKFIKQINRKQHQTLYPNMDDFSGYLTTDSLDMLESISFYRSTKDLSPEYLLVKCGNVVFVYQDGKIIDSYGFFNGLGYCRNRLHHNGYAFCSGADGVMDYYFGIHNISDHQILENINQTHKNKCSKYR